MVQWSVSDFLLQQHPYFAQLLCLAFLQDWNSSVCCMSANIYKNTYCAGRSIQSYCPKYYCSQVSYFIKNARWLSEFDLLISSISCLPLVVLDFLPPSPYVQREQGFGEIFIIVNCRLFLWIFSNLTRFWAKHHKVQTSVLIVMLNCWENFWVQLQTSYTNLCVIESAAFSQWKASSGMLRKIQKIC